MHKRTQEEKIFGCWVVVSDGEYERFYDKKDAEEYKQFCIDNGMTAYIHLIETESEDDNFGYYFE